MQRPQRSERAGRWRFALRKRTGVEWLQLAITAGLSLAIVAQAAMVSERLWMLARTPDLQRPAVMTLASMRRAGPQVQDLVAAHLFGKIPDAPQEATAAHSESWVLSGTLQGATPASGAAILGPTATSTRYCAVGQEVPGGFRLTQVFADRVTIERAGESLSLKLPRKLTGQWVSRGDQLASTAVGPRSGPVLGPHTAPNEWAQNNPLARRVLLPMLRRGAGHHWDGMRVQSREAGAYGLQRNDVIRDVNGHAIDSLQAQSDALETLSQGRPVTVTVERDGALFKLEVDFSQSGS
jgi:general secretion pathway protein C